MRINWETPGGQTMAAVVSRFTYMHLRATQNLAEYFTLRTPRGKVRVAPCEMNNLRENNEDS